MKKTSRLLAVVELVAYLFFGFVGRAEAGIKQWTSEQCEAIISNKRSKKIALDSKSNAPLCKPIRGFAGRTKEVILQRQSSICVKQEDIVESMTVSSCFIL